MPSSKCFNVSTFGKKILEFTEKRWPYSFKGSVPWYYKMGGADAVYLITTNRLYFDPNGSDMSVLHEALHMYDALNVLSGIVMTPGGSKVGPESITYAMEAIFETLDNIDRFENYLTSGKFIDCNDVIETWKTHTGKLTVTTQHYMIQGGGYTRFETQFKYVISDTNTGRIEAWAFKKLKDEFGLKIDCAALVKHLQPLIDKQFECCKIDCSHVSKEFGGSKE